MLVNGLQPLDANDVGRLLLPIGPAIVNGRSWALNEG